MAEGPALAHPLAMDVLARNLSALAERDPALARAIETCAPDSRVVLEPARSGAPTLRVDGRLEASAEDPERESRDLARGFREAAERAGAMRWVLFGLGVHTLRELDPPEGPVLVVEPSLAICRAVLGAVDLSEALRRISLVVGEEPARVLGHRVFREGPRGIFLAHPAARRRARALHDRLAEHFFPGGVPGALDIAVVPPLAGGSLHVARACARALRELGHRVREVDWTGFPAAYDAIDRGTAALPLAPARDALRAGLSRLLGEWLLAQLSLDPPDLVFALAQAPLCPETLAALGRRGILRAFWFCEDAHVLPYWKDLCRSYDAFFHLQSAVLSEPLREWGVLGAELPLGFDPQWHRPLELTSEQRRRYGCALSFVGAGYHNRQQFLPALADLGLRLYGTAWPAVSPFVEMSPEFGSWQSTEVSNQIFNATAINLNLHSSPWVDGVNPVGDYLNPRCFELAGAGAFQLVDARRDLPRFFEPGREIIGFRDLDECRRLIQHYRERPDERAEIAQRARARALAEHTYRHRMAEALDRITAGPLALAPRRRIAPTAGAVRAAPECEPELGRVLGRLDPGRVLDAGALGEAVSGGEGELCETERLLLFMRESMGEVVLSDAGSVTP